MAERIGEWERDTVVNTDALSLLRGLPDGSVGAVIADPPYGLGGREFVIDRAMRRTDNGKQRGGTYTAINEAWDMVAPLDWFGEIERILKPGGSVVIFAGRNSVYTFAAEGLRRDWLLVNDITWKKKNPVPCFTGRQMTMATERVLWFCPDGTPPTVAGYVYLLSSPFGFYKIGCSSKPQNRLLTFGVQLPFAVDCLCTIYDKDMYALEKRLHREFISRRVQGEWFKLTPADVEYIKGLAT